MQVKVVARVIPFVRLRTKRRIGSENDMLEGTRRVLVPKQSRLIIMPLCITNFPYLLPLSSAIGVPCISWTPLVGSTIGASVGAPLYMEMLFAFLPILLPLHNPPKKPPRLPIIARAPKPTPKPISVRFPFFGVTVAVAVTVVVEVGALNVTRFSASLNPWALSQQVLFPSPQHHVPFEHCVIVTHMLSVPPAAAPHVVFGKQFGDDHVGSVQ